MKAKPAKPKMVQEPPAPYNESAIVIYEMSRCCHFRRLPGQLETRNSVPYLGDIRPAGPPPEGL